MVTETQNSRTMISESEPRKLTLRKLKENSDPFYDDVIRIISVCKKHGYIFDYETARQAWRNYSDLLAATWMILPEDDGDLFSIFSSYVEVIDGS